MMGIHFSGHPDLRYLSARICRGIPIEKGLPDRRAGWPVRLHSKIDEPPVDATEGEIPEEQKTPFVPSLAYPVPDEKKNCC
jgi:hypothetical protein